MNEEIRLCDELHPYSPLSMVVEYAEYEYGVL